MSTIAKETTEKLVDLMTRTHRVEIQKLVRRKQITESFAKDITTAYTEGAKSMLDHLVKMGVVEYMPEETDV